MRVLLAAVAVALLAGCVAPGQAPCTGATGPHTPWVDGSYLRTDPDQPWDTVVLQDGGSSRLAVQPSGWSVAWERLSDEGAANFSLVRVQPSDAGPGRLDQAYRFTDCGTTNSGTIVWDLEPPMPGDAAEPGQGTHVYTAGFYENGTLFYTNIKAIDQDDWPRAAWYAWEGGEPLPVYVYDEDRSEQPLVWGDPFAMTPVAGTGGLGYYTTIPGFNEALKGLSTNTVRVARLAPEEAYTRPGNEEHPLYGDALVFYIKVVGVVDLPCPLGTGRLCGLTFTQR